jgi:phage tail sheath protein FI
VDTAHGVWRAPAGPGASLNGAASLEVSLDDADAATINALGLNTIRLIRNRGVVVWGARTLVGADQTSSEWKYVPVRRTALYIEGSVSRGTQWAVFEPNGEPLWAQIRLSVDAFMRGLFDEGAFQGTSPQQAYFVRCGSDTTTEADIDAGIVNIVVGFAPLRPAEFVVIRIGQRARPGKTAAGGCQRVST